MLGRIDTALTYITEGLDEDRMIWMLAAGKLHDGSMYNLSTAVHREMLSSGRFYSLGPVTRSCSMVKGARPRHLIGRAKATTPRSILGSPASW